MASINGVLFEHDAKTDDFGIDTVPVKEAEERKMEMVWANVIKYFLLHVAALYGGYLFCASAKWQTDAFACLLYIMSALGMTAGAHRLWSHRSYKAKWPLRLILVIFNTFTFQTSAFHWARDHRLHHKYSETDGDPHNATRGIFFSHIGWTMVRKHPQVVLKGKDIDLSDLYADPFVMFQKKYFRVLELLVNFILPTVIPVHYWNESCVTAFFVAAIFRITASVNATCLINSAAHLWGNKPYDELINPTQNFSVTMFTFGEGYHNYHHTFPWDYKAAELNFNCLNFATHFINFFSKIGWAYDLKTVSEDIIRKRVKRTGDGSHALWGWGDKDQTKEDIEDATILNEKVN